MYKPRKHNRDHASSAGVCSPLIYLVRIWAAPPGPLWWDTWLAAVDLPGYEESMGERCFGLSSHCESCTFLPGGRLHSKLSCFIKDNSRTEQEKTAGGAAWKRNREDIHADELPNTLRSTALVCTHRDFTRTCLPGLRYLSKAWCKALLLKWKSYALQERCSEVVPSPS